MALSEIIRNKAIPAALLGASVLPFVGCSDGVYVSPESKPTSQPTHPTASANSNPNCEEIIVPPRSTDYISTFEIDNGLPATQITIVEQNILAPFIIPKDVKEGQEIELPLNQPLTITRLPQNAVKAEFCTK